MPEVSFFLIFRGEARLSQPRRCAWRDRNSRPRKIPATGSTGRLNVKMMAIRRERSRVTGERWQLTPQFVEARYNLANLLLRGDAPAAAAAHYRIALQQEPDLACAWYNLAYALAEQGLFEEAANALTRALGILPANPDAHFNLALCYEELDRHQEAIHHWQAFLRLAPTGEWAEIARCHLRFTDVN